MVRKALVVGATLLCLVLPMGVHAAPAKGKAIQKDYTPFSEPRPALPQEMLADKRLDQRVKVFVKSRNLGELFAELSQKTGVKLTAGKSIRCERPILYFHDRPLRDVLDELSGLYGYRWLIAGRAGAYEYEMFEDTKHFKRRAELKQERKERMDALLLDFIDRYMADDKAFSALAYDAEEAKRQAEPRYKATLDQTKRILSGFGPDLLAQSLSSGQLALPWNEYPSACRQEVSAWLNDRRKQASEEYKDRGQEYPQIPMSDMGMAQLSVTRKELGSELLPNFEIAVRVPDLTWTTQWPGWNNSNEAGMRSAAGWPEKKRILAGEPLPDDPNVTVKSARVDQRLLLGDILQAIAEQSGMDAVADYYFDRKPEKDLAGLPLSKAVEKICTDFDATCQVSGKTLRFRHNKWFTIEPLDEPPARLIQRLWAHLEEKGMVEFDDLLDIASLPESQLQWPGLDYIRGATHGRFQADALRFWKALSPDQLASACSESGLHLSELTPEQLERARPLARRMAEAPTSEELAQSIVLITEREVAYGSGTFGSVTALGTGKQIEVTLPSGKKSSDLLTVQPPMSDDERRARIAERKADAEADVIDVLQ